MNERKYGLAVFALLLVHVAIAQVDIGRFSAYQKNFLGKYAGQENVSADNGGYYTVLLQNTGNVAELISGIRFKSNAAYYDVTAWYCTSAGNSIAPGAYATLFIKATAFPFRENDSAMLEISTNRGVYTRVFRNVTPLLRFSAIVPDTINQQLYIYLRNTDTADYFLDTLFVDGTWFDQALAGYIAGGQRLIKAKETAIIRIPYAYAYLKNVFCGISYRKGTEVTYNHASVRLLPPSFTWGTWHSSSFDPDKKQARKDFRSLRITTVHGPGNTGYMQQAYDEYFLQTIIEANFSRNDSFNVTPAIAQIVNLKDKPFINCWTIDDEPDLNGKDIPEQIQKANTYRQYDLNTPVHINLAVEKKYCRYGWYADIVSMDHYAAPPAPNIINLRWVPIVGQPGELYEALDYTEALKWNAEPRRIWTWVQFAPGPWDYEEDDFALNIQFWMHIFGGAKSIEYFVAQAHTKNEYPALWQEAQRLLKQFSTVEHLVGFAEPSGLVKSNTVKCVARALVSDKYLLLGAINNNVTYTWNGSFSNIRYNANIQPTSYQLEFTIPAWITSPAAFRILPDGRKTPVTLQSLGNNKYRIQSPENLYKQSHVFIIGPSDEEAPLAPSALRAVDKEDNSNYTLSWNNGSDNLGVAGYLLYLNGELKDTVYGQVYEVENLQLNCPVADWSLRSFDLYRNISANQASLSVTYDTSIALANLVTMSTDSAYNLNEIVTLTIDIAGNAISRQWQVSVDTLNWINVAADTATFVLIADSLVFRSKTPGVKYYRQQVIDGCGNIWNTPFVRVVTRPEISTFIKHQVNDFFSVFPNPSAGQFQVKLINLADAERLEVYNGNDRLILSLARQRNECLIDLQNQPAGIYYLVAYTAAGKKMVKKLVVIK